MTYDEVKMEPVDEDFVPARLKNKFAEEFNNLVPDECFDLTEKTDSEKSRSGSGSDTDDSDYYNPRRKRKNGANTEFQIVAMNILFLMKNETFEQERKSMQKNHQKEFPNPSGSANRIFKS